MRLRTDSAHIAGWKRAHRLNGCPHAGKSAECVCRSMKPENASVPEAEPGDVWRTREGSADGPVIGYGLTCPNERCDQGMHIWTHAYDCTDRTPGHSCWTWTGSPETDDLTATPSLHVMAELGGCGWHGWLRDGVMVV